MGSLNKMDHNSNSQITVYGKHSSPKCLTHCLCISSPVVYMCSSIQYRHCNPKYIPTKLLRTVPHKFLSTPGPSSIKNDSSFRFQCILSVSILTDTPKVGLVQKSDQHHQYTDRASYSLTNLPTDPFSEFGRCPSNPSR